MSKHVTYTCDRCGQTVTTGMARDDIRLERYLDDMSINDFRHQIHVDLCVPCGDGLREYIRKAA